MITKMTKYSIILLTSDMDDFLIGLQELGMMDITRSDKPVDGSARNMFDTIARYGNAIGRLAAFRKKHPDTEVSELPLPHDPETILDSTERHFAQMEECRATLATLRKNMEAALPWGEFRSTDVGRLASMGLHARFYSVSKRKFNPQWQADYPLAILNEYGGRVYFTVITPTGETPCIPAEETQLPGCCASELGMEMHKVKDRLRLLEEETAWLASMTGTLAGAKASLATVLDRYSAMSSSTKEGEDTISVLEGFAPEEDMEKICGFLDTGPVVYIKEEATADDDPPVKLKNNAFARLFEPIGSLYMLPRYGEWDLTPFFAPFYMLFFGLCLGDMGYGLLLIATGLAASIKLPKFKAYGKLIIWLGVGSIIMPLLSGTFFGMKLADIIPMPENIKSLFFSDMKMFWFSIIFGLLQIVFARILKAIQCFNRKEWDPALTEIGWCMIILWAASAYAGSQTGNSILPETANIILAATGTALVLFFSKPAKFFLLRPLKGIVSLYDITGIFGDMLSYIRLFGLGTTGGILALVINSISMSLSGVPYIGWALAVLLLIIGHIAVMGLSCLGAFVHPIRLTFVEFYKNAGFEGGGRPFNPLKINK